MAGRQGLFKPIPRGVLKKALAWHGLTVLLCGVLTFFYDELGVYRWFMRLAWWIGPWRSFPVPYDMPGGNVYHPGTDWLMFLLCLPVAAFLFVCFALLIHGVAFLLVVWAHKRFGWPRYWNDVQTRLDLPASWAESARRCWWVWPASLLIWDLIESAGQGFTYAFYPLIETGPPWYLLNLLAVSLLCARAQSRLLQGEVIRSVTTEDLRCMRCGYMLRGLRQLRCPECGSGEDRDGKARYGLLWSMRGRLRRASRVTSRLLPPALLLAPVWVPLAVLRLPMAWIPYLPSAIQPSRQVLSYDQNRFPVRFNAVALVRHGGAIGAIQVRRFPTAVATFDTAYWARECDFGRKPPDQKRGGRVARQYGIGLPVGPWNLSFSSDDQAMIWLDRPDATYEVQAFEPEHFPGDLSWLSLSSQPASEPSSRPDHGR